MVYLFFVIGLVLLIWGADFLVKGSVGIAKRLKISPLVIGLTIVAVGTSSPELFVSVKSVFLGQPDIVLGNIIGSNVFNVLFILGLSSLICPLAVSKQLLRMDIPVMVGAVLLSFAMALDGTLSRAEGAILLGLALGYTVWTVIMGKKDDGANSTDASLVKPKQNILLNICMILAGLAGLMAGAQMLVGACVSIARSLGVSELVIALTLVAAGTSLPEVAASVMAACRGERDMAIGNVVGSNIYNLLLILGASCVVSGAHGVQVAPSILSFDFMILILVSIACVPIFFSHYIIDRWEGALFLGYYMIYAAYLVLKSTNHDSLPFFSMTLVYFIVPLSFIIIAAIFWSSRRAAAEAKGREEG